MGRTPLFRIRAIIKKYERTILLFVTLFATSLAVTALLLNLDFNFLEAGLYDLRMTQGYQKSPSSDIALVSIDAATTKEFDEFAPLSLKNHVRFLEQLVEYQPRAVGYLLDLNRFHITDPKFFDLATANEFVAKASQLEKMGISFLLGTPFDVTGEVLPPVPLNSLPHAVAIIHKDGNVFAEDKVTRRALLTLYDKPAFHLELVKRIAPKVEMPSGNFYLPEIDGRYFFFRYHGSTTLRHSMGATNALPYPRYSFADILQKRIPIEAIQGKVILVGTLSFDDSTDFAFTPYSSAPFSNPKLLVHANILDSILQNDGLTRPAKGLNMVVTFLVTFLVLWWIITLTPMYGVFASLGLGLVFVFFSHVLFQLKGIWVRESQPLVGIFVGYYLAVPYRLIREYKKRWDYQRKNELLTQVEELKTNFLSLITHDLKTPVAKIQGLAEVLLRNAASRLSSSDKDTVKNLMKCSEELNRFISSILELNRVESNPIKVNLEAKDINQLIERSIESLQQTAASKNISIEAKLEPLFPIKIDPSLILKVLNNLIDNAIKYSRANSRILVESKEVGEWVCISIQDYGIGLSLEEKENLFTRFYRAKNETTAAVAGTGLGLYLTKYFIEVHGGSVNVESEPGRGSTFRIQLPISSHSIKSQTLTQSLDLKFPWTANDNLTTPSIMNSVEIPQSTPAQR